MMFVLDNLNNQGKTSQGNKWQFFTDGVMGGKSSGEVNIETIDGKMLPDDRKYHYRK